MAIILSYICVCFQSFSYVLIQIKAAGRQGSARIEDWTLCPSAYQSVKQSVIFVGVLHVCVCVCVLVQRRRRRSVVTAWWRETRSVTAAGRTSVWNTAVIHRLLSQRLQHHLYHHHHQQQQQQVADRALVVTAPTAGTYH